MSAPIPYQDADPEFNSGSFDAAAFAASTLAKWQSLAAVIDHTLLKADATREQVENFVQHLADWAEKDRNALLCQLNSYPTQKEGAA